jgi:hypothetical protein
MIVSASGKQKFPPANPLIATEMPTKTPARAGPSNALSNQEKIHIEKFSTKPLWLFESDIREVLEGESYV